MKLGSTRNYNVPTSALFATFIATPLYAVWPASLIRLWGLLPPTPPSFLLESTRRFFLSPRDLMSLPPSLSTPLAHPLPLSPPSLLEKGWRRRERESMVLGATSNHAASDRRQKGGRTERREGTGEDVSHQATPGLSLLLHPVRLRTPESTGTLRETH